MKILGDLTILCFQQIFEKKKKKELLKCGYFHFSVSSSTLTASWQSIFVSAKPSGTILLIDRSKPRFESHTGGKIRKT